MVELQKKYQIGTRRFGLVNWVGTYSLFKKEVLRFLTVSGQTLFGPIRVWPETVKNLKTSFLNKE